MLNLIPFPRGAVKELQGKLSLPKTIGIDLGGFEAWCIQAFLERLELTIGNGERLLRLERVPTMQPEKYSLNITEQGITVQAASESGIIWALTTAANLYQNGTLPCCYIEDTPKYPHRGLHLDCARHFFPARQVKKVIEEISLAKMNVLHWHLSDDQGWRIESKQFPKLHEKSKDYFTQNEIREIVAYAKNRGVEIIPEIDMPGHTRGILSAYPKFSCTGENVELATGGGIYSVIFCPGKDDTFDFVEQLLTEVMDLFPSKRFHIGGDEAPKTAWKKCPHCKKRMTELGLTKDEDLQGYFSQQVNEVLKKRGKQAICWNETLLASNYPADIQVQYWTLQHREAMQEFAEQGGQWIYSDMFEFYFDYPYSMSSVEKVYTTIPHLGKKDFADNKGLLGMEACLWTEHITEGRRLENLLFPRIYALAEICWYGQQDYMDFKQRLKAMIQGKLHREIQYTKEDWWEPKGKARREEAINYFTSINAGMSAEVRKETVQSAKPNREFGQSFMQKFFKTTDLFFLLKAMMKK